MASELTAEAPPEIADGEESLAFDDDPTSQEPNVSTAASITSSGALTGSYSTSISSHDILNGFLSLHSKTGLLKSYKTKWFVYGDDSGKLFYYKSRGDLIPEGEILITHATFSFDVKDKPGVFEIRTSDQVYVLEASDRQEMLTWLQELQSRRREIARRLRQHQSHKPVPGKRISDEYIKVEVDEIPKITVAETPGSRPEKPTGATITKLSSNVSKAADSAKQKLTSMFQRKSQNMDSPAASTTAGPCTACRKMELEMYEAKEDSRVAREELAANQNVLKMLHNNMDMLQQEISTLQSITKVYQDPEIAAEFERQKEHNKLLHMISELQKDKERLAARNQELGKEIAETKECQQMMKETLQAKDNVILALSAQVENMQKDVNPNHIPVSDDVIDFAEPYHDSLKTKLEAYELQNKFLNKEILELHAVLKDYQRQWDEFQFSHMELEAKYYQLQSKHLIVIHELNKPQIESHGDQKEPVEDEVVSTLLHEAMQLENERGDLRETLTASLRVQKKYDSYGFEVKGYVDDYKTRASDLQAKSQLVVSNMHESAEAMSNRVKWENFLTLVSTPDYKIQRTNDFKNLVRAGIPKEHRERVWKILIEFHVGDLRKTVGKGYYERLINKHSKNSKRNPYSKQIEMDLRRTLPDNKYFEDDKSEGIPKLRNVLLAYSCHNATIGYCQGMNRLAAFALLFLKEEDAFWCLVAIVDFIMPPDYFSKTMMTAQADQRVLRDVLLEKVSRVVHHLDTMEMDISLFSFNWFITLFIENIPIPMVLRIWDVFLFEGIKVLFRFATAFFKYAEEKILRCTDYITANQYLRDFGSTLTDVERITYIAFSAINPFPLRSIHNKRAAHLEQVKNEFKELKALRDELRSARSHYEYNSDCDDEDDLNDDADGAAGGRSQDEDGDGTAAEGLLVEL